MNEGIYPDIPFKDYLEIDAVSNSYLGRLEKCPANALVQETDTPAMQLGRAVHALILEGETGFYRDFIIAPVSSKNSNKYKEFVAENPDKEVLSSADEGKIFSISNAVQTHPLAKSMLSEGVAEQTMIWKDRETGILCKGRVDFLPPKEKRIAIDVKTTGDASQRGFLNSCVKYGYARQNSFYTDGLNTLESPLEAHKEVYTEATETLYDGFVFIVVEKVAPFRVEVYMLDEAFIERGRSKYKDLLKLHKDCKGKDDFPHYTNKGIVELEAPVYY